MRPILIELLSTVHVNISTRVGVRSIPENKVILVRIDCNGLIISTLVLSGDLEVHVHLNSVFIF